MRRAAGKTLAVVIMGSLVLAVAACGGGNDEATSEADSSGTAAATATSSDTSSGTPDFASTSNCQQLGELGAQVAAAMGGTGTADAQKTIDLFSEFADQAPAEIRDDFQVVADAYSKIADALGGVNVAAGETPDPEALQKLQEASSEIDQAKVTEATNNITAWVTENCS
jgi:hypothetical protein